LAIAAALFLPLNLYWLVPVLTSNNSILNSLSHADMTAFAPIASSRFGVIFDVASMHGFWRDGYFYTANILPFWWILFLGIAALALIGFFSKIRDPLYKWLVIALGFSGIISLYLAIGASSIVTSPIFTWLWDHFTIFRGLRDSQKFVSILCLVYAYLGSLGLLAILEIVKSHFVKIRNMGLTLVLVCVLLLPPIYSIDIFNLHGQLGVTAYPKEWQDINSYLNSDTADFNVLFLPWHQYMTFTWNPDLDKKLRNPAPLYFDKPTAGGDNIEKGDIQTESSNPISKFIEYVLSKGNDVTNLGELLAPLNIKYIVVVNEADYQNYSYLYKQTDLKIIQREPGITLIQNLHSTSRVYGVNSVEYIQSLDDYIKLSQTQDVMEHIYILGDGLNTGIPTAPEKIPATENSPVSYQIGTNNAQYSVFTVPQDVSTQNWQYSGGSPLMYNLGLMPVFSSAPAGGNIIYSRFFRIYLPCYIVSTLTLIMLLVLLWFPSRATGSKQK
jgi:hypothetical protein